MKKSKQNPKISVCMPVYNAELWLAESIDSILNQTFEDWELIIVNDYSTDASVELIKYYESVFDKLGFSERFITLHHKSNQGIAITRNHAAELAKGEIICVQDADDVSHKNRLEKTWKFMNRHKAIDLIYGHCQYIDALSKPFHMVNAEAFSFARLKRENIIQHPTVAYRKKSFDKVGGYRKECRVIDDWFLYYDFHKAGMKLSPLEEVLSFYRILRSSVSRSPEKAKEIEQMKTKFLEEANEDSRSLGK